MTIKLNGTCPFADIPAIVKVDYLEIGPTFDEPQPKYKKGLRESCSINSNCRENCQIFDNAPEILKASI